jgi:hypothetical protein
MPHPCHTQCPTLLILCALLQSRVCHSTCPRVTPLLQLARIRVLLAEVPRQAAALQHMTWLLPSNANCMQRCRGRLHPRALLSRVRPAAARGAAERGGTVQQAGGAVRLGTVRRCDWVWERHTSVWVVCAGGTDSSGTILRSASALCHAHVFVDLILSKLS